MNHRTRLLFLFLFSAALRIFLLGSKSLWIDECLAWGATRMGWLQMVSAVSRGTPHPPLAFILMKLSTLAAGGGEFGLRLPAALAVASAVIPVYRLASRRTSPDGGFYAGLFWAVSPFSVSLGQEAWAYGPAAALSLWLADTADLAWRGSRRAYATLFPLGIAGLLTQHIFVISVAVACALYLSVPVKERISFRRFTAVPAILALAYLPLFLFFLPQFTARAERTAAEAGLTFGLARFLTLQPFSQFLKLAAGGLLPDVTGNLLERPRMLIACFLNAMVMLSASVLPLFFRRRWGMPGLKWLWAAFLLPFALFLNDEPTVRQLAVLWVPLAVTSGALFTRFRFSGVVVCALCAAALAPYYMMDEYPYHRSNWRLAVSTVEELSSPGDVVVIFGGKSTSLAWEFYSRSPMPFIAPGGDEPFEGEEERSASDPVRVLQDTIRSRETGRIWVIADLWGVQSIQCYTGEFPLAMRVKAGEEMEVGLLEPEGRPPGNP